MISLRELAMGKKIFKLAVWAFSQLLACGSGEESMKVRLELLLLLYPILVSMK